MSLRTLKVSAAVVALSASLLAGSAFAQGDGLGGLTRPAPTGPNPAVAAAQAKPTPKSPWGHPDLTASWMKPPGGFFGGGPAKVAPKTGNICILACTGDVDAIAKSMGTSEQQGLASGRPDRPQYKDDIYPKVKQLEIDQVKNDPVLKCANPGLPRIGAPDKIVQSANQIVILYDDLSGSFWRIIPTDNRAFDASYEDGPLGQSIGHWEGDTLVVVTKNLSDDTWLIDDGAIHTGKMTVTERISRVGDSLTYETVVDDPTYLKAPWKRSTLLVVSNEDPLQPVPCIDQTVDLIVDGSFHDNAR